MGFFPTFDSTLTMIVFHQENARASNVMTYEIQGANPAFKVLRMHEYADNR